MHGSGPDKSLLLELQKCHNARKEPKIACGSCRARKIRCDCVRPRCGYCTRQDKLCNYDTNLKRRGRDRVAGSRKALQAQKKSVDTTSSSTTPSGLPKSSIRIPTLLPKLPLPAPDPRGETLSSPLNDTGLGSLALDRPKNTSDQKLRATNSREKLIAQEYHLREGRALVSLDSPASDTSSTLRPSIPSSPVSPHGSSSGLRTASRSSSHRSLSQPTTEIIHMVPLTISEVLHARIDDEDDEMEVAIDRTDNLAVCLCHPPETNYMSPGLSACSTRLAWWDTILSYYGPDRRVAAKQVTAELSDVLSTAHPWMSFLDIPLFFVTLCNPAERTTMQPALVLGLLAVATLLGSNELEKGHDGRTRAFWLRDVAQSALEASLNTSWIEPSLAQAAMVLAFFEICPHSRHSSVRCHSAILLFDALVQSLSLTCIDADDPRASIFPAGQIASLPLSESSRDPTSFSCDCLALFSSARQKHQKVSDIRKEETRRMIWAAHNAFTVYTAKEAEFGQNFLPLFITNPFNYSLLFPGESALLEVLSENQLPNYVAKESLYALYCRVMLLWCSCLYMRHSTDGDFADSKQLNLETQIRQGCFAVRAWSELFAIEEAFNHHYCHQVPFAASAARNWILGIRTLLSHDFSAFSPHPQSETNAEFQLENAVQWTSMQMMEGLSVVTQANRHSFARKPAFLYLFQTQILRCLNLWEMDHSLTVALNLCKTLLPPLEYQTCLWPSPEQEIRNASLRQRLAVACLEAGLPAPLPPNLCPY